MAESGHMSNNPRSLLCSFFVPGDITPMGRPRFVRATGIAFTPAKSRSYQAVIRDYAKQAMNGQPPFDGPCALSIMAVYPWPSSWSAKKRAREGAWKATKPDLSNISKGVEDGMNRIVFSDDARIAEVWVGKQYGDDPGLAVEVSRL